MITRPAPTPQPQRSSSGDFHLTSVTRPRPTGSSHSTSGARRADEVIDLTRDGDKALTIDAPAPQHGVATESPLVGSNSCHGTFKAGLASKKRHSSRNGRGKPDTLTENLQVIGAGVSEGSATALRDTAEDALRWARTASAQLPARPGRQAIGQDFKSSPMTTTDESKQNSTAEIPAFEMPHEAARFPAGKGVDFYPWTGEHAEDCISEHVIRSGYFEQQKANLNESNTARPSLWSHLKNKSGLQTMSSLLVTLLEKRRTAGRVSAISTFKPPPRVTFKDKRREEWLRDLANPAVALRVLSRTIPHGVRGKGLLEQCLSKNIPSSRAVWLVKCVGANEMRAFKRKGYAGAVGSAGEMKWIREWTTHVEQFVDNVIEAECDETWRNKMTYTIRLASHLYAEHLLDHDHYLDWLLSSFESSALDRTPVWLLLVQIHWEDLVSRRKRGWRLARSLLLHIDTVTGSDDPALYAPVTQEVRRLVGCLLINHPECLMVPRAFSKYKPSLIRIVEADPSLKSAFNLLEKRIISLTLKDGRLVSSSSPKKELVAFLDAQKHSVQLEHLSSDVLAILPHWEAAAEVVLHWACSAYRQGHHRLYLASRLFCDWRAKGLDTDGALLRYLSTVDARAGIEERYLFRIIAELARTKNFSVGRYLQHLIAIGALGAGQASTDMSCVARLIFELPFSELPPQTRNLRQSLIDDTGHTDKSSELLAAAKNIITQQVPGLSSSPLDVSRIDCINLTELTIGTRLELARWLRDEPWEQTAHTDPPVAHSETRDHLVLQHGNWAGDGPRVISRFNQFTGEQFGFVRDIMEQLEDFSTLAEILETATESSNPAILGAAAETLTSHCQTFSTLGALQPICRKLLARCFRDDAESLIDHELFRALTELSRCGIIEPQTLKQLSYRAARHGLNALNAVCSPASQHPFESPLSADTALDEGIHDIVTNVSHMDEQSFKQAFSKVIDSIRVQHAQKGRINNTTASLLRHLQNMDYKFFSQLLYGWLFQLLQDAHKDHLRSIFSTLVVMGSLDITDFVCFINQRIAEAVNSEKKMTALIVLKVLEVVLPSQAAVELGEVQDVYRYRLAQQRFYANPKSGFLALVRTIIDFQEHADLRGSAGELLQDERLLALLRHAALDDAHYFALTLGIGSPELSAGAKRHVSTMVQNLTNVNGDASLPKAARLRHIVASIDELSLPFCQLQLRQTLIEDSPPSESVDTETVTALFEAVSRLLDADMSIALLLLGSLEQAHVRKLGDVAKWKILSAVPAGSGEADSASLHFNTSSSGVDGSTLNNYLVIVHHSLSRSNDEDNHFTTALLQKLKAVVKMLITAKLRYGELKIGQRSVTIWSDAEFDHIYTWIRTLLHLMVVYDRPLHAATSGSSQVMCCLSTLYSLLSQEGAEDVADYVADVLSCFTDDATGEAQMNGWKVYTHNAPWDTRLCSIFGSLSHSNGWLNLRSSQHLSAERTLNQKTSTSNEEGQQSHPIPRLQFNRSTAGSQPSSSPASQTTLGNHQQNQPTLAQQLSGGTSQRTMPFVLRRWEVLPDSSANTAANDTALNLGLFGARKT